MADNQIAWPMFYEDMPELPTAVGRDAVIVNNSLDIGVTFENYPQMVWDIATVSGVRGLDLGASAGAAYGTTQSLWVRIEGDTSPLAADEHAFIYVLYTCTDSKPKDITVSLNSGANGTTLNSVGNLSASTTPKLSRWRTFSVTKMRDTWNALPTTKPAYVVVNKANFGTLENTVIHGVRVFRSTDPALDDLGVFCGSTPDTEALAYTWTGTPYHSTSTAGTPAPPPDPITLTDTVSVEAGALLDYDAATTMDVPANVLAVTSGLPDGCALNTSGHLAGRPTTVGTSAVILEGIRTDDTPVTLTLTLTVTEPTPDPDPDPVDLAETLSVFTGDALAVDLTDMTDTGTLTLTGGIIPDGLTFNGVTLSGTPTTDGTTALTLEGTRADRTPVTLTLTVTITSRVDPVPTPELTSRVMVMLGIPDTDQETRSVAVETVDSITLMVRAYTRGRGFTEQEGNAPEIIAADLQAVIVTASTRLLANPSQLTYRAGQETLSSAFQGWSLAEQFVLNGYRKRWA